MKQFWALLKVSFKRAILTSFNMRIKGGHTRAPSGAGSFVGLCVIMLFISCSYSFSMAYVFSLAGAADLVLYMMIVFAIFFPFVMVVFASQALIFSVKDINLVLSLPVSAFSVMLARLLALYLEALAMVELLLLPAGIAFMAFGGGEWFLIPMLLVQGLFIALIPTTLALLAGCIVAMLTSLLPLKNLFTVLFSFGVMALFGVFYLNFIPAMRNESITALGAESLRSSITLAFPPIGWMATGAQGNLAGLLLTVFISVAPFLLITWLFSFFYKGILTRLNSHKMKSNYRLHGLRTAASGTALFKKEARRFFTTPAYLMNSGVMYVLFMAAGAAAAVKRGDLAEFIASLTSYLPSGIDLTFWLPACILGIAVFTLGMSFVTCVSISLEGKSLWILKEAPISTGKIFAAKAGFGAALPAAAAIFSVPLAGWGFGLPVTHTLAILAVCIMYGVLSSMAGLYINLLLPRMDAENDTLVIKQSASVLANMLADFLLALVLSALFVALGAVARLGFLASCAILAVLIAALSVLCAALLNTSGRQRFARL